MENRQIGRQSVLYANPPYILKESSVVGKKEGEGPLGKYFDEINEDPMCGGSSWEEGESRLQERAVELLLQKSGHKAEDIRFLLGGDLLGQLIATSFGIENFQIPFLGLYGACSTMGESLALGSMLVAGGFADYTIALTSSHFASAEKQFRFPLGYGNQRPFSATWTVTGSGAVLIGKKAETSERNIENVKDKDIERNDKDIERNIENMKDKDIKRNIRISGVTLGRIVDFGVKDSMNMGACMAPAAADLIVNHFRDFERKPEDYDQIITGDLGVVGHRILREMLLEQGYPVENRLMDCGNEIYDSASQDTHAGGSGCGCSAVTLTSYILRKMRQGEWRRVLFVPTGALLSTVSFNEGNSVPGIAHGIILETEEGGCI